MHVVHDSRGAEVAPAGLRSAHGILCATVIAASAALTGCFGSSDSNAPPPSGGPTIATPVRLTDCSDWNAAGPSQRSAIIEAVRTVSGGPTGSPGGHGAVLDNDKAYNLFDAQCRPEFSKRFRLYKLYTRAAAFQGR
jgi:hypothetical protein